MLIKIGNVREIMENGEWRMDNGNLHFPISILQSALCSYMISKLKMLQTLLDFTEKNINFVKYVILVSMCYLKKKV